MQKNYIQFLVLALVATGMVMIAGIRNDLDSLESQMASSPTSKISKTANNTVVESNLKTSFSMAEIEKTINRLGWVKQVDNSYTAPGGVVVDLHYACPNCQGAGSGCCVVNGVGSPNSSGPEGCWGSYGTTNYQGICSVPRMDTGGSVTATARTSSGSTGSSGTTANRHMACNPARRPCSLGGSCCYPSSGGAPYGVQNSEGCSGTSGSVQVEGFCSAGKPATGTGGTGSTTTLKTVNSNGTSNPILTTTLRLGAVSSDVTKLQKMLVSLGYLSTIPSGNFLSKTESAVKAFQTAYGISPASGIVGPMTREKLNSMCTISSDGSVVSCSQ